MPSLRHLEAAAGYLHESEDSRSLGFTFLARESVVSIYLLPTRLTPCEGHVSNDVRGKGLSSCFSPIPERDKKKWLHNIQYVYTYKAVQSFHTSEKKSRPSRSIAGRIQNLSAATKFTGKSANNENNNNKTTELHKTKTK